MKKLALDLDQLVVESFATAGAALPAGTVRGHGVSETPTECLTDCYGCTALPQCLSYDGTCDGTCGNTAQESCTCPTFAGETCELTCNFC
ncbi:MAG TPA: hypothetical protein VFJ82_16850 [Longimicrobium sp.]|nr:hypothetical protein [Longimicrobium sp.]